MKSEERINKYNKVINNNKLIVTMYNELIRLEQEGLEFNNEYFTLLDLIRKYKYENEVILKSYPLMDGTIKDFQELISRSGSNNLNYYYEDINDNEEFDDDDDDYDDDEYDEYDDDDDEDLDEENGYYEKVTIYDAEVDGELAPEYLDNNENNINSNDIFDEVDDYEDDEYYNELEFNIDYSLNPDEVAIDRFCSDIFYYASISNEVNNNELYANYPAYVNGCYMPRYHAIQYLYRKEDITLEEAEARIDEKLEKKINPLKKIIRYEELKKEKLIFFYRKCCQNHITMSYLLDEINKADQRTVQDLLIVRKYKLIAEYKCLEDTFLNNPRCIANPQLYKKLLLSMYNDEETRKNYFSGWEDTFKNLISVLNCSFLDYENCSGDEECIAHNITNKTLVQAYSSMLFDKQDLHQANKIRNKVVNNIKDKSIKKVVSSSKILKRNIILSEK